MSIDTLSKNKICFIISDLKKVQEFSFNRQFIRGIPKSIEFSFFSDGTIK